MRASYGLDAGAMVARLDAGAAVPSPVPVAMPRFSPLWPLGTLPHPLDAVVNLFNAGGYRRFPASDELVTLTFGLDGIYLVSEGISRARTPILNGSRAENCRVCCRA